MAHLPPVMQALAQARSFLFVPGDRPERHAKALAAGADAVIIDLEDAVTAAAKPGAAQGLRASWHALAALPGRPPLLLRCNAAATPWFDDDLALATLIRPDALVLPKAESAGHLAEAARRLAAGRGDPVALLPLIESAAGLASVRDIAASGLALRLLLGHLDLQADLGMHCSDDEGELDAVRLEMVLASRLHGLPPPVDGVTVATGDARRLAIDTQRSRRFGFTGKLCIHPSQVAGVHQALAPPIEQLQWARRVMEALAAAPGGVVQVDGKMVDAPVIRLAQQVLAAARP
jgi:citrate lyase subunit beta / citryl-CoA lyase